MLGEPPSEVGETFDGPLVVQAVHRIEGFLDAGVVRFVLKPLRQEDREGETCEVHGGVQGLSQMAHEFHRSRIHARSTPFRLR